MPDLNRRDAVLEEPAERRSRFGDLGDRVTKAFSKPEQPRARPSSPKTRARADYPDDRRRVVDWDEPLPRFPVTRQGYDCAAVDEHIAELEHELMDLDRELAEARARTSSKGAVAAEMERIGEQTSAILIAAHEQAKETTRRAQEQADKCIADAASNAVETTADAQRQLRAMEDQKASLGRERDRLIEDIRTIATSLTSLADGAAERFPSSPQRGGPERGGPERGGPERGGPERGGPERGGPERGGHERGGPVTAAASRPAPATRPSGPSQSAGSWQPALASAPEKVSGTEKVSGPQDQPTVADLRED